MKTVYTARDPLWTACQRVAYQNIVRRAIANTPSFRDLAWLTTALDVLDLSLMDYYADVAAMQTGETPPRLRGDWADLPTIQTRNIEDQGVVTFR